MSQRPGSQVVQRDATAVLAVAERLDSREGKLNPYRSAVCPTKGAFVGAHRTLETPTSSERFRESRMAASFSADMFRTAVNSNSRLTPKPVRATNETRALEQWSDPTQLGVQYQVQSRIVGTEVSGVRLQLWLCAWI